MMRKYAKLRRDEAGYALVWVLVLLIVSGLVLIPLLLLMTTGLTSSEVREESTQRFYAADAGIEDATYKIQNDYDGPLGQLPEDADDDPLVYTIEDVNGNLATVVIESVWILEGAEEPKCGQDEQCRKPHSELVTVGDVIEVEGGTGTYSIEMTYDGSLGELKVDKVGAWLPAGFEYVWYSSGGITSHLNVPDNPTTSEFRSGTLLEWEFTTSEGIKFEELPPPGGGEPGSGEFPVKRILYFQFTPAEGPSGAFSWVRTTRNDIYLSWDLSQGVYLITSTAEDDEGKQTTIESYVSRSQGWEGMAEVHGDYRAIGQSLMKNTDSDRDRDTLLFGSSAVAANVDDIPDGATIEAAYLYWSAWRRYPTNITGYSEGELAELADEVDEAKFKRPGKSSLWVTADRVQIMANILYPSTPHGWSYSCFADVTDLISVLDSINGNYKVKKIDGIDDEGDYWATDDEWSYAGWSLIIIYSHPGEDAHQLYFYDDFLYVEHFSTHIFPIEGFLAPELDPGDEGGRLTYFVGEGDVWYGDQQWAAYGHPAEDDIDSARLNDNYLSDEDNPQYNVMNGKSSGLAGEEIDGVDIDTFDVSDYISLGDNEAELKLSTGVDIWNLVYVILSFRTEPGTNPSIFPVRLVTYTHGSE